jgi:hypothetical protein
MWFLKFANHHSGVTSAAATTDLLAVWFCILEDPENHGARAFFQYRCPLSIMEEHMHLNLDLRSLNILCDQSTISRSLVRKFPNLTELTLHGVRNLRVFYYLPKLKYVTLIFPFLRYSSYQQLSHLQNLEIVSIWHDFEPVDCVPWLNALSNRPNLRQLHLNGSFPWNGFDANHFNGFRRLEVLHLKCRSVEVELSVGLMCF